MIVFSHSNCVLQKVSKPSLSCLLRLFQILLGSPLSVPCTINAAVGRQLPQSENQTDAINFDSLHVFILIVFIYDLRNLWSKREKKSYAGCINYVNCMLCLLSPNNYAEKTDFNIFT